MKLTDSMCRNAKPKTKPYKLSDGKGLYLLVTESGARYWRMKYRYLEKEKLLSIGVYPQISLAEAREAAQAAQKLLRAGIEPIEYKNQQKREAILKASNTFEAVARSWHETVKESWSKNHSQNVLHRMETDIFPYIGKRPIADIEAPELLGVLLKIEERGAVDVAKRARQIAGQVFRYGIAKGHCKRDIALDLKDALKRVQTKHYAALDMKEMPEFLRTLSRNEMRLYPRTRRAAELLMLTFVRTAELIEATWDEFDLDAGMWEIPAERMKMKRPHIVPLSYQAIRLLREQKEETAHLNTSWVFPSQIRPSDPMSNNTVLGAIKRMGYKGKMTGHGFRAVARTAIRENLHYDADIIERQLAHAPRSKVVAAYDRTQFIEQRRVMMQDWANYLDTVAQSGKVIIGNFRRPAA